MTFNNLKFTFGLLCLSLAPYLMRTTHIVTHAYSKEHGSDYSVIKRCHSSTSWTFRVLTKGHHDDALMQKDDLIVPCNRSLQSNDFTNRRRLPQLTCVLPYFLWINVSRAFSAPFTERERIGLRYKSSSKATSGEYNVLFIAVRFAFYPVRLKSTNDLQLKPSLAAHFALGCLDNL